MQNAVTIPMLEALPVLEATGSAVFVVSRDGRMVWLSRAAEMLTLTAKTAITGREASHVLKLLDEDGQPIAFWQQAGESPLKMAGTAMLVNRFGAEFPVFFTAAPASGGVVLSATLRPPEPIGAAALSLDGDLAAADGLRTKSDAEAAIRQCVEGGDRKCAAVFAVDRLPVYRRRYGPAAVKQLKSDYAQHLCHALRGGDELYEWGAPGFLILLEREGAEGEVREELKRIASRRLECSLQGSSAIISLQAQWNVKPLWGDESADDLIAELEQFVQ